jgi:hypothetical protein
MRMMLINRAPVLTLWASVVAERLGFDADAALSLAKGVAGLNAQSKGRALGIFKPGKSKKDELEKKAGRGEEIWIELCGRPVPAKNTDKGVRAVIKDKPIDPESARRYLDQKFGADPKDARVAMEKLARSFKPSELEDVAFSLYEKFRPKIPAGEAGWGAKGKLDFDLIESLAGPSPQTD